MRLNAEIIFEHLAHHFDASLHGKPSKTLDLSRPVFYMEQERVFHAKSVYVASADHLPAHPRIEKDVMLVCVGNSLQLKPFMNKCCVIQIRGDADYFSVYLTVQEIFDRFDSWNDKLFELFKEDADIASIVSCSTEIFDDPIVVIDNNFHIIAAADSQNAHFRGLWKDADENLSQYSMRHFLERSDLLVECHGPMFLRVVDSNALCVNLYDNSDRYIGCLCILVAEDDYRPGYDAVASYLARIIERSIEKNPAVLATEHNVRKGVLKNILGGIPASPEQRWLLENADAPEGYICVILRPNNPNQAIPEGFLTSSFEMAFPDSYSFQTGAGVACIVNLSAMGYSARGFRRQFDSVLASFAESLKVSAGISFDFKELGNALAYLHQADTAMQTGSLVNPSESRHYYEDYALSKIVVSMCTGAPIETLFPYELRLVLEHDRHSSVSLLDTLKTFLDENMNYSKTANLLFIHRSTLVDRIGKIENEYGIDLRSPDTRLYLQLLLKAIDMQGKLTEWQ